MARGNARRDHRTLGRGDDNTRMVFDRARKSAPCILVLEDLDSVVSPANPGLPAPGCREPICAPGRTPCVYCHPLSPVYDDHVEHCPLPFHFEPGVLISIHHFMLCPV